MVLILLTAITVLAVAAVLLLIVLLIRSGKPGAHDAAPILQALAQSEAALREEAGKSRQEASSESKETRQELSTNLMASMKAVTEAFATASEQSLKQATALREEIQKSIGTLSESTRSQLMDIATASANTLGAHTQKVDQLLESVTAGLEGIRKTLDEKIAAFQGSNAEEALKGRKEMSDTLRGFSETMHRQFASTTDATTKQFEAFSTQILSLTTANEVKMETIRTSVESRLQTLQDENGKKLEEMRQTVDEKLHATLEKRLGESFLAVSSQLESVHKGLGEMKALGAGVGDLKRVLSGVKTRGILGEVLLGSLLEQVLTPEQYEKNACVREGSAERVDYAIRMPGRDETRSQVYLPIDSKFPLEDFQRLQDAYEQSDLVQIEQQLKQLEARIKNEGKSIASKYINPPDTTDFAILFLPNENLYAEVIRRAGLQDFLYRECRVVVCGPTNLAGLLNSLSMGFRTLAIAKKSSEVWETLGVVKTQFGAFADLLEGVKSKLIQTTNKIDAAATKARTIERKLRTVEALPIPESENIDELSLPAYTALPEGEDDDQEASG